jgi:sodium pump decarboxylase gamma subunit
MNFLLEVTDYTKPVESFADRITFGGFMLLLGMAIVFAVLVTIWGCLSVFKLYFTKNETKPKETVVAPLVVETPKATDDSEIVAVIAAAIAAAEADSDGVKFKVVSFRRK